MSAPSIGVTYRSIIERVLDRLPDRKNVISLEGVSQEWVFDLNLDPIQPQEALGFRVDSRALRAAAVEEIRVIVEELEAAGLPANMKKLPRTSSKHVAAIDSMLCRDPVAHQIWSYFFVPIRFLNGELYHLRATGDSLDPIRVVRIPMNLVPTLFGNHGNKIGKEILTEIRSYEKQVMFRNLLIGVLLAILAFAHLRV